MTNLKLKAHVRPKLNPIFARFKFNNEIQGTDSIESYLTRLRLAARDCEYGVKKEEMIRDRLVFGTNSSKVREKLINVGSELTLDKAVQIAQSYEYSQEQLKSMSTEVNYVASGKDTRPSSVRKPGKPKSKNRYGEASSNRPGYSQTNKYSNSHQEKQKKNPKQCGNCGTRHPYGSCPAKGQQCNKCSKFNHYARVCRSSEVNAHAVTSNVASNYESDSHDSDFCC